MKFIFRRRRDEEKKLKSEIAKAKAQLKRAEEAQKHVTEVVGDLKKHLKENHIGERLQLQFDLYTRRDRGIP